MEKDLKSRIQKNARVLRFISRAEMFQKSRQTPKQEISYLKVLNPQERQVIMQSMDGQVPSESQLPPLGPASISYYRRSNKAVYQTRVNQIDNFHPHMTYESLYILAAIQENNFKHYQHIVKEFETDLEKYLDCEFPEIREMAMIVSGNKIIGREKEILRMIELDRKQLWVLINHIYERKISVNHLFPYLGDNNEIVYRSLFEMSNGKEHEVIEYIMEHESVIETLITSLKHFNPEIKKFSIRIFGNILAEKEEYAHTLAKYGLLEHFLPFLSHSDPVIRKDTCWALSNYAYEKAPSTSIIQHPQLIEKLVSMFHTEKENNIKVELSQIFSHLVAFADKKSAFQLIIEGKLLQRCSQFLEIEDAELVVLNLYLIKKIIELGDHFSDDDEEGNYFVQSMKNLDIHNKIREKTYSEDAEISKLSSELQQKLEDDD